MSGKNQFPNTLQWQDTDPSVGFLPLNNNTQSQGSVPSGVINGVMDSTDTIYSQIVDVSRMDNCGFEIAWSGTPTGTLSFFVSDSGINFSALTFSPNLAQPSGSDGKMTVSLNQLPFKYVTAQYVNATGTGVLNIYCQFKDLN